MEFSDEFLVDDIYVPPTFSSLLSSGDCNHMSIPCQSYVNLLNILSNCNQSFIKETEKQNLKDQTTNQLYLYYNTSLSPSQSISYCSQDDFGISLSDLEFDE